MNFTVAGIALALSAAFGCWGGYKATSMHYELVIDDQLKKDEADRESDRLRKQAAAGQYEAWKAAQRPKSITATREVEHAVEVDSWGSAGIPAGVRAALAAAAASTGAGVADAAVPGVPGASAADESGSGFGLRLGARLGRGLPSSAQVPR